MVIEINNAKVLQQQAIVLDDVNFTLDDSEFVYLIGRTGSGKSSLLKLIYGELPLKEGTGSVAGFNLRKLSRRNSNAPQKDWNRFSGFPIAYGSND